LIAFTWPPRVAFAPHQLSQNGVALPGAGNRFTTSTTQLQTFKVEGTVLGYKGNHDEHLAPVVGLLAQLKTKLQNSIIASQNEVATKKATADAAKTAADQVLLVL
jgi:hypothetical protein